MRIVVTASISRNTATMMLVPLRKSVTIKIINAVAPGEVEIGVALKTLIQVLEVVEEDGKMAEGDKPTRSDVEVTMTTMVKKKKINTINSKMRMMMNMFHHLENTAVTI